jgi:hypothetical protein
MLRRLGPLTLLSFAALAPLAFADGPLQPVDVKTVKSADYTAGATVRISGTAGELSIQTWDQPRVEATLETTEYASDKERDAVKKNLERIGLAVEKQGNDIDVEMKAPHRNFIARWTRGKTNADVICRVMVPKDAKLVVRHDNGSVMVYGASADIDASARFGDVVVQLNDPGSYAIDAKVNLGGVYTEYSGDDRSRMKVGEKFATEAAAGAPKITLRVSIGGITIVKMGPIPTSGF